MHAADRLEMMAENFERKGIKFYITEHSENVNEQMRKLGIGHLIEEGKVRRTILAALQDAGIPSMGTTSGAAKARDPLVWMPWQLEIPAAVHAVHEAMVPAEEENTLEEFVWAFGDDAVGHYPEYRAQSLQIQTQLKQTDNHILEVCDSIKSAVIANGERIDKRLGDLEKREKNSLRAKILNEYRLYTDERKNPMQA